jgi:hypothetical protein
MLSEEIDGKINTLNCPFNKDKFHLTAFVPLAPFIAPYL